MKAIFKWGYDELIMPFEDAVVLIRTLENAEFTEDIWDSELKDHVRFIGGKTPKFKLELLSDDEYAVAKMRGAKPESKS